MTLPAPGALVLDEGSQRVGIVTDVRGGRVQLRPPAGAGEWDADPATIKLAGPVEKLRARVAEANAAGRWGR